MDLLMNASMGLIEVRMNIC